LVALLATVRLADAPLAAVGVKVTLTVQEPPAAIEVPQVLVCANGAPAVTEEIVAAALPVLVTVTFWAAAVEPTASLPNATEVGAAASVALPPLELVPVPDRLTALVTPPALTVSVPVREPVAVGLNVTLTVQEPPAAIDEPQVPVWLKSPVAAIDETDAAELAGLETVTV
jgi:hypothetical protein